MESEDSGVRHCERRRKSVFADNYLSKPGRRKIPVQMFYVRGFEIGPAPNLIGLLPPWRLGHRADEIDHEAAIVHRAEVLFVHDRERLVDLAENPDQPFTSDFTRDQFQRAARIEQEIEVLSFDPPAREDLNPARSFVGIKSIGADNQDRILQAGAPELSSERRAQ